MSETAELRDILRRRKPSYLLVTLIDDTEKKPRRIDLKPQKKRWLATQTLIEGLRWESLEGYVKSDEEDGEDALVMALQATEYYDAQEDSEAGEGTPIIPEGLDKGTYETVELTRVFLNMMLQAQEMIADKLMSSINPIIGSYQELATMLGERVGRLEQHYAETLDIWKQANQQNDPNSADGMLTTLLSSVGGGIAQKIGGTPPPDAQTITETPGDTREMSMDDIVNFAGKLQKAGVSIGDVQKMFNTEGNIGDTAVEGIKP